MEVFKEMPAIDVFPYPFRIPAPVEAPTMELHLMPAYKNYVNIPFTRISTLLSC
jgi:hypothetical protein